MKLVKITLQNLKRLLYENIERFSSFIFVFGILVPTIENAVPRHFASTPKTLCPTP